LIRFLIPTNLLLVFALLFLGHTVYQMDSEVIPDYVCKVQVVDRSFTDTSTGSFLDDNTVLTCSHGLRDYREGYNKLVVDGQPATILYKNDASDVCILRVDGPYRGPYPKLGVLDSGLLTSMGYAKGTVWTESNGYKVTDAVGGYKAFSTCRTIQGMSGGPVVNSKGELVGMVFGSDTRGGVYTNYSAIMLGLRGAKGEGSAG
jgi:hypothetical protein